MSFLFGLGLLIGGYLFLRILCGLSHILIDLVFLGGLGFCVLMLLK